MNKIKELRKESGIKQRELAKKAGCHIRILQKIEDGEASDKNVRLGTFVKIADALNTDIYGLFGYPLDWEGFKDHFTKQNREDD